MNNYKNKSENSFENSKINIDEIYIKELEKTFDDICGKEYDYNLEGGAKKKQKSKTKSKRQNKSKSSGSKKSKYDFVKISDGYIQIYVNNIPKQTKQTSDYLYFYKTFDSENDKVCVYKSDEYPDVLTLNTYGYMFVKNGDEIPILPKYPVYEYKTNFVDFNTYFHKNVDANVVIKFSPSINFLESHPSLINEYNYLTKLNKNKKIDVQHLKTDWIKSIEQCSIKSSLDWFEYISKNCPTNSVYDLPYNYYSKINNSVFDKVPTLDDIVVYYDIKSTDEYSIIEDIELTFENKNQNVIFYETYNNKLKDVKKRLLHQAKKLTSFLKNIIQLP